MRCASARPNSASCISVRERTSASSRCVMHRLRLPNCGDGRPSPRMALGRAAATKQTVQIADVQAEPGYFDPLPGFSGAQAPALAGLRTIVAVPLLKENDLIGVI